MDAIKIYKANFARGVRILILYCLFIRTYASFINIILLALLTQ